MATDVAAPSRPTLEYVPHPPPTGSRLGLLTIAALGVVYGDIGTSPLYALRECFKAEYGILPTPANILGVLSLVTWSLLLVVSIKYIVFVLRADNHGEGGVLALLALLLQQARRSDDRTRRLALISLGIFGAALLYGDGIITPAISVLGAVEGLEVGTPGLARLVVPLSLAILLALFMVQKAGTAKVGALFGPIMLAWFATISALGLRAVLAAPAILSALDPRHAVQFFVTHGLAGFLTLGAVVLCVTGGEALYADMGHFGKRPIRIAWFAVVLPALLLNYLGQGALLLATPSAASNPFYLLAPAALHLPLLVLATAAAVVASQALISGAFSLTQQSIQLGYSPRMQIIHTSGQEEGQIYIPEVNTLLAIGCLLLVLGFQNSSALSAAYGIAVTGTMAITSLLFAVVARERWHWSRLQAYSLVGAFLVLDVAFLGANVVKITHGGWVPILVASVIFLFMSTWKHGRRQLSERLERDSLPVPVFLLSISRRPPVRVPGTAVFLTSSQTGVPAVLLHHLKHNKVLHETVLLLSIATRGVPEVPDDDALTVENLSQGFHRIVATYGFMQSPNVPEILTRVQAHGISAPRLETSYYLGRERIEVSGPAPLPRWRKRLFSVMARNARTATEFFHLPPDRVVELGAVVEF